MRVDLLRSKAALDRTAETVEFQTSSSFRGDAINDGSLIHAHVHFEDYAGDPPHVRVSIGWVDIETMVNVLASKGHPEAIRALAASRLAAAVEELGALPKA